MSLFRGKLFAGALFVGTLFGPSEQIPVDPGVFHAGGMEAKVQVKQPDTRKKRFEEEAVVMAIIQFVLEQSNADS